MILAFGNSLTAGFGVLDAQSYPSRLQKIITENGYPHKVINGGVSGDTTAGGSKKEQRTNKKKHNGVKIFAGSKNITYIHISSNNHQGFYCDSNQRT